MFSKFKRKEKEKAIKQVGKKQKKKKKKKKQKQKKKNNRKEEARGKRKKKKKKKKKMMMKQLHAASRTRSKCQSADARLSFSSMVFRCCEAKVLEACKLEFGTSF